MTIAASFHWILRMFDVSAAFLRGDAMDAEVYFRPPREGLPGVPEGSLIKAIKGVFGLRVAPRLWYKKAKAVLEDAGWTQLASLPGVFVLRNEPAEIANRVLGRDDLQGAQRLIYVLDLTKPNGMFMARDFVIRDEDTLYVTEAPFTQWSKAIAALTGSLSAVNTLTSAANGGN